jgi:plasmid stabilization system protein ParE
LSKVILSELAESDLTDLWAYVAQDNLEAADHFVNEIYEKCSFLGGSAKAGRLRPGTGRLDSKLCGRQRPHFFTAKLPAELKWLACFMGGATFRRSSIREHRRHIATSTAMNS